MGRSAQEGHESWLQHHREQERERERERERGHWQGADARESERMRRMSRAHEGSQDHACWRECLRE